MKVPARIISDSAHTTFLMSHIMWAVMLTLDLGKNEHNMKVNTVYGIV